MFILQRFHCHSLLCPSLVQSAVSTNRHIFLQISKVTDKLYSVELCEVRYHRYYLDTGLCVFYKIQNAERWGHCVRYCRCLCSGWRTMISHTDTMVSRLYRSVPVSLTVSLSLCHPTLLCPFSQFLERGRKILLNYSSLKIIFSRHPLLTPLTLSMPHSNLYTESCLESHIVYTYHPYPPHSVIYSQCSL